MICRDPYSCYPWVADPRVATVARLGPNGDDRRFVAARLVPDKPTRGDLARLFEIGDLFATDVQDRIDLEELGR